MQKLSTQTQNKVTQNRDKIAALFPNCLTERKNKDGEIEHVIDFDKLKQELSDYVVEGANTREGERYQFTWPDKKKSILLANAPISKTLRPCREESVNFDTTENLYIEGDNLDVLKILQETYLNKVKMIYIDPPYNTGNDFVYEDDFAQSLEEYKEMSGDYDEDGNRLFKNTDSNGRFHTDWLNMIYPRLKVAKDLLTEDGVIFISIDDNEVHNLRKICDEVFGERNFVAALVWQKKTGASDTKGIATITENILVYCKNNLLAENIFSKNTASYDLNRYKLSDEFVNTRGSYYIDNLDRGGLQYSDSLNYGIECPDGTTTFPNGRTEFYNDGWIWKWSKSKIEWARENKFIEFRQSSTKKSGWAVCYKNYLHVDNEGNPIERAAPHKNLISDILNSNAASGMKDLFGTNNYFNYSKPMELVHKLLSFVKDDHSIILDFFSGSATTAHAVMQLNAEDNGNRKFIMVQLPEETDEKSEAYKAGYKNICEIGKERIRRAGAKLSLECGVGSVELKGNEEQNTLLNTSTSETQHSTLKTQNSQITQNSLDIGFRVLKVDSSNTKEEIYTKPRAITQADLFEQEDNIKEERTAEDLLFQAMLQLGVLLSHKIEESTIAGKKVFTVNYPSLIACFDENITEEVITEIAKKKPFYFVMRDSSMASDSLAVNFDNIFKQYSDETKRLVL